MLGNVIPGSDRIPGSINTTASAAKTLSSTRSEVSAKLKLSQLSTVFNIAKEKLFLDLSVCKNGNCGEMWQLFLADTCIPALSSVLWIVAIWIGSQFLCQDIELGQMLFFQHCKTSMLGNVIPGSNRIPGSRNTAASATKQSSSQQVWSVSQMQGLSTFNIAKEAPFTADLILCKNGNCGENGSLTVVIAWHMHVCSLFGTGDRKKLDCCPNVL